MKLRNKKTGEIEDLSIFGISVNIRNDTQPFYRSIKELCEDWEDYTPPEPLIKDEKICKAVRAWSKANEFGYNMTFTYYANTYQLSCWQASIEFNICINGLKDGIEYSLAELCGEEE